MATGVSGFFRPRMAAAFAPFMPLRSMTRARCVKGCGVLWISTILMMRVRAEHIMASAALPPAFAPEEIEGRFYGDGGLVSNMPLQFVMENLSTDPLRIFQVNLFSARDGMSVRISDVGQREKHIR